MSVAELDRHQPGDRGMTGDEAIPLPRHRVEAQQVAQQHAIGPCVGEHGDPPVGLIHVPHGKRLLAAIDTRAARNSVAPARTRSTKSRDASPPATPSHRSDATRDRSSSYAFVANSAGVPCQLGSRISSRNSSITSSAPRFASDGAAVWRGRTSGEMTISSNSTPSNASATCSAWRSPRSVSGGSTTLSPSRTHSGSPWRISTISICFLSPTAIVDVGSVQPSGTRPKLERPKTPAAGTATRSADSSTATSTVCSGRRTSSVDGQRYVDAPISPNHRQPARQGPAPRGWPSRPSSPASPRSRRVGAVPLRRWPRAGAVWRSCSASRAEAALAATMGTVAASRSTGLVLAPIALVVCVGGFFFTEWSFARSATSSSPARTSWSSTAVHVDQMDRRRCTARSATSTTVITTTGSSSSSTDGDLEVVDRGRARGGTGATAPWTASVDVQRHLRQLQGHRRVRTAAVRRRPAELIVTAPRRSPHPGLEHPRVRATRGEQFGVRAVLDQPAVFEHHHSIGACRRRQAVGDGDRWCVQPPACRAPARCAPR